MGRYLPAIATDAPERLTCQPGQWINYQGARGRYAGRRAGLVFIAWTPNAQGRAFPRFRAIAKGV